VTRVSTLLYLTPPATAVTAWIMFGQTVTVLSALGMVVCAIAVMMVLRSPRTVARRTPAVDPKIKT
ncbi:MAG: EamA family transporter, partial [Stackebrandtia sp.]